jgi:DeoR family transcriptional regulator, glycerol-3-phosphate regulon repressor
VRIGHISQVDIFVTDTEPPEGVLETCREHGVKMEMVDALTERVLETDIRL